MGGLALCRHTVFDTKKLESHLHNLVILSYSLLLTCKCSQQLVFRIEDFYILLILLAISVSLHYRTVYNTDLVKSEVEVVL